MRRESSSCAAAANSIITHSTHSPSRRHVVVVVAVFLPSFVAMFRRRWLTTTNGPLLFLYFSRSPTLQASHARRLSVVTCICEALWWIFSSICRFVFRLLQHENHTAGLHRYFCAYRQWPCRLGPSPAALRYVVYFRFCGWRHVFTWWPYGASCVFLSGDRTRQAYNDWDPITFCSTIETKTAFVTCELRTGDEVCHLRLLCYIKQICRRVDK